MSCLYFVRQIGLIWTVYYRLRQIDFDGTETVSKVVAVVQIDKGKGLAVYPNPVSSLLTIDNTVEERNPDAFGKGFSNPQPLRATSLDGQNSLFGGWGA
jgi:hypothetical protein